MLIDVVVKSKIVLLLLCFCYEGIHMSRSTLLRRFKAMNLKRRNSVGDLDVHTAVHQEIAENGNTKGEVAFQNYLDKVFFSFDIKGCMLRSASNITNLISDSNSALWKPHHTL